MSTGYGPMHNSYATYYHDHTCVRYVPLKLSSFHFLSLSPSLPLPLSCLCSRCSRCLCLSVCLSGPAHHAGTLMPMPSACRARRRRRPGPRPRPRPPLGRHPRRSRHRRRQQIRRRLWRRGRGRQSRRRRRRRRRVLELGPKIGASCRARSVADNLNPRPSDEPRLGRRRH